MYDAIDDQSIIQDEPTQEEEFVCGCNERHRLACKGLGFYREYGDKNYCILHYPDERKVAEEFDAAIKQKLAYKDFHFHGIWFPASCSFNNFEFDAPAHFNNVIFNADVFFYRTKFKASVSFINATFSGAAYFADADFKEGGYFNDATFSGLTGFRDTTFSVATEFTSAKFGAKTDFSSAKFSEAVYFSYAMFDAEADFSKAIFGGKVDFRHGKFNKEAIFYSVKFNSEAAFNGAEFNALADFRLIKFADRVIFNSAKFEDYVKFREINDPLSERSAFDFCHAIIEHPERVSFHTMSLRPHSFVNVDPRKFEFTNVDWKWTGGNIEQPHKGINQEIQKLAEIDRSRKGINTENTIERVSRRYRLLSIACRDLATNAEEKNRYSEAGHFRYWAMDLRRLEKWQGRAFWTLDWWYWLASGYGERISRAFCALLGVWMLFALLYKLPWVRFEPKVSFQTNITATQNLADERLSWSRTFVYSLGVMALQKLTPSPSTNIAYTLVYLETGIGPLQIALLALAVRRRYMR